MILRALLARLARTIESSAPMTRLRSWFELMLCLPTYLLSRATFADVEGSCRGRPDHDKGALHREEELMGYIENNLLPGEDIIYRAKLHWILLQKVEGIGVDQGIGGRLLTGGTKEPFKNIANLLEFRKQVQAHIPAWPT